MAIFFSRSPQWWDRKVDSSGNVIRRDVRDAAKEIWSQACRMTKKQLGDFDEAAELLENSVSQISRYLDKHGIPLYGESISAMLMGNLIKRLKRRKRRRQKYEDIRDLDELVSPGTAKGLEARLIFELDRERFRRCLEEIHPLALTFLILRQDHNWKEIGRLHEMSAWRARTFFRKAVHRALLRFSKQVAAVEEPGSEDTQASRNGEIK